MSVVAAVAAVVVLAGAGLFALSRSSSNHAAGTSSTSGSGGSSSGATANMPMGGTGNPAMLTAYVQPSVWKAYHCQRQMPPVPIAISNASAPTMGLLDSATCEFTRAHISVRLDLFNSDTNATAGWRALLAPTQLVPSRTSSCNRHNLKNAGVWRHMDMQGAREGGQKFCDLSTSGYGYIVWTVRSQATANPSTLTHSLLLSAFQAQGKPRTILEWWHNCRHQLGEGTGGMVNMPHCPT